MGVEIGFWVSGGSNRFCIITHKGIYGALNNVPRTATGNFISLTLLGDGKLTLTCVNPKGCYVNFNSLSNSTPPYQKSIVHYNAGDTTNVSAGSSPVHTEVILIAGSSEKAVYIEDLIKV